MTPRRRQSLQHPQGAEQRRARVADAPEAHEGVAQEVRWVSRTSMSGCLGSWQRTALAKDASVPPAAGITDCGYPLGSE